MRRFFIDPNDVTETKATITGDEAHHISDVLRLKPGTVIELFDGNGKIYQAQIEQISKGRIENSIISKNNHSVASHHLAIGVALLTGKKMDLIVQKATELGITSIHPYISRHCSVKDRNPNKEERWQRIALEACKQCNRPTVPECKPTTDFSTLLGDKNNSTKLIFWEKELSHTIADTFPANTTLPTSTIAMFGPEGGYSEEEIAQAVAAGFTPVSMGSRILRAETAVISGIAILQYLLGNLNPAD